jgi:K+/H+ antiporter YhaU regulatory subunit KhtT
MRRFPAPWTVEAIEAGFKVLDANKQAIAYVYSREYPSDALIAKVLTEDEARRIGAILRSCQAYSGKAKRSAGPFTWLRG